jgi:hypothetical protein
LIPPIQVQLNGTVKRERPERHKEETQSDKRHWEILGDRVEGDVLDKTVDPDYLSSTIPGYHHWWSDQTRVILLFYIYVFPLLSQEELSYVTSLDTLLYSSLSKR